MHNMKLNDNSISVAIPLALLISFPFIQWGASPYLSFQMFCFLILFASIDYRTVATIIPIMVFVALAMFAGTLFYTGSPYFLHSMLKVIREVLCLFILMAIYDSIPKHSSGDSPTIKSVVSWMILVIFISTALQFYFYNFRSSTMFFVPAKFYIGEFGTFAENSAAFAQQHGLSIKIRPSSFYAEPSYLGFIALSLLVIILKVFPAGVRKHALILTLLTSLALSRTLSGLISFGLLFGAFYFKEIRRMHPFIVTELLLLVPIYFLLFPVPGIFLRLLDIGDPQKELSGFIRLVLPFEIIGKVLLHSPQGVPQDELMEFLRRHSAGASVEIFRMSSSGGLRVAGLDNAFLNFFIFYGMLGLIVVWTFVKQIKDRFLLFYLFLTAFFNGALLSFDKVAVISTVFLIVGHWRLRGMELANCDAISVRPELGSGLDKTS
jgi:hypothetical protein